MQFVGRHQLKNGNLWLKTGSCSASSGCGAKSILASHDFAMSGKFSPLPAKWKHRFAWRRPNEHAQDYSCPEATFAFCSHGEKLPRQGGLPGVVQRVTRLSKLPRGNRKLMWTVTGVRQSWPRGQWVAPGQWVVPGSCEQALSYCSLNINLPIKCRFE